MKRLLLTGLVLLGLVAYGCNEGTGISGGTGSGQDSPAPRKTTSTSSGGTSTFKPLPVGEGMGYISTTLPVGSKNPALVIEKTAPKSVIVGIPFDYTIRVTNLTGLPMEESVVTAHISKGIEVIGASPEATASKGDLVWKIGTLAPGASKAFVVRGKATSVGGLTACSDVSFKTKQPCLAIKAVQPAIKITKTATPTLNCPCDPINYKIVVTNTGSGPATNVTVVDPLPAGVTSEGKTKIVQKIGTLLPGQSKEIAFVGKAAKEGKYENVATVTADHGLKDSAKATTDVFRPVLKLTKTGPKKRFVGRPFTYTIEATNVGTSETRNTVLTDVLPPATTFVSASDQGAYADGKVVWKLGSLQPKASKKVTITLKSMAAGEKLNRAVVVSRCSKAEASAVTVVSGIPALLLECVDDNDPVELGGTTTYTISVTNQGSAADQNVVVVCELPAEQELVSAAGSAKATTEGKKITFAAVPVLQPKQKAVYTVKVKGVKAGDSRFKVSMTSKQLKTPVIETESTNIYGDE